MTDRRSFLTVAGAAAVTGLVGCTPPNQPATQGASGVTVPAKDVPVGSGMVMSSGRYVVTQPEAGVFKAFNKTCTHQGCPVSDVKDDAINCRCHGAKFSPKDGSVTQGPATKGLKPATVTVEGDNLRIADA